MGKIKDFFKKHRSQREVSLKKDFESSLIQVYNVFDSRAHLYLSGATARWTSKIFLYQCEDVKRYVERFEALPERVKQAEAATILELKIDFLSYADELVNMDFEETRLMQKLKSGNEMLRIFEHHIIILELRGR